MLAPLFFYLGQQALPDFPERELPWQVVSTRQNKRSKHEWDSESLNDRESFKFFYEFTTSKEYQNRKLSSFRATNLYLYRNSHTMNYNLILYID